MEKLEQLLDPSQYKLWILLGAVVVAAGLFIASIGGLFAAGVFGGIGRLFWQTGAIVITTAVVVGGLTDEELPEWLRTTAVLCAALMTATWF